jgi:hypothetical protein
MLFGMFLYPFQETQYFTSYKNKFTFFLLSCFYSPHWGVDIVLSVDSIRILINIVIVHPTQTDLVWRGVLYCGVVTIMAIWMKEGFYHDHHLVNVFFSHGCFHQQSNNFFNQCVKMAWPVKTLKFLLYPCCIPCTDSECWWLYKKHKPPSFWGRLLLQGRVILGLEFYGAYAPFL